MQNKILMTFSILSIYLFTGCVSTTSQTTQEYNKPAVYWYNKMIQQISNNQIDDADDTYTSLESEHRNSTLIPSAIMIIAHAHMEEEEYKMTNYYFDEYLKKFGSKKDADYIRYLKIKSNFLAFKNEFREQELLTKTLLQTSNFIVQYPNSQYIYLVKTMKSRLLMAKAVFDQEIADLYDRLDKPKAKEFYKQKANNNWEDAKGIKHISTPWYRTVFE